MVMPLGHEPESFVSDEAVCLAEAPLRAGFLNDDQLKELSSFELLGYADCKLRSSEAFALQFSSWLETRDILAPPCYALSLAAGLLIMR